MGLGNNVSIFFILNVVILTKAAVFTPGKIPPSCSGSLHLYSPEDSLGRLGVIVSGLKVEGCGCYVLYEGTNGAGKSFLVSDRGEQSIEVSRIRSVQRVTCREYRVAGVVGIAVTTTIILVIIIGISFYFCKKRRDRGYTGVNNIIHM